MGSLTRYGASVPAVGATTNIAWSELPGFASPSASTIKSFELIPPFEMSAGYLDSTNADFLIDGPVISVDNKGINFTVETSQNKDATHAYIPYLNIIHGNIKINR